MRTRELGIVLSRERAWGYQQLSAVCPVDEAVSSVKTFTFLHLDWLLEHVLF